MRCGQVCTEISFLSRYRRFKTWPTYYVANLGKIKMHYPNYLGSHESAPLKWLRTGLAGNNRSVEFTVQNAIGIVRLKWQKRM